MAPDRDSSGSQVGFVAMAEAQLSKLLWSHCAPAGCALSECLPNGVCQRASRSLVQLLLVAVRPALTILLEATLPVLGPLSNSPEGRASTCCASTCRVLGY